MRAATLARFAPLLLLLYAIGAADGFTQRAIRRACGGRESAGLYYPAKYLQVTVLGLGGVYLLLWSGPVRWELCVPLGAVLLGGLASVQWAYYKKHMYRWLAYRHWPRIRERPLLSVDGTLKAPASALRDGHPCWRLSLGLLFARKT